MGEGGFNLGDYSASAQFWPRDADDLLESGIVGIGCVEKRVSTDSAVHWPSVLAHSSGGMRNHVVRNFGADVTRIACSPMLYVWVKVPKKGRVFLIVRTGSCDVAELIGRENQGTADEPWRRRTVIVPLPVLIESCKGMNPLEVVSSFRTAGSRSSRARPVNPKVNVAPVGLVPVVEVRENARAVSYKEVVGNLAGISELDNADRSTVHRLAQVALVITLLLTVKLIDW